MTIPVYRVRYRYTIKLEKLEAERVTNVTVVFKNRTVRKESDGIRFFENFEEAKQFTLKMLSDKFNDLTDEISTLNVYTIEASKYTEQTVPLAKEWTY